ncbi:MAG TPA: enoyl-CoA hydratase/isomerase family protein, partial [Pyrinomonadaceae bacterium]|nr:enoyl-CoA hydratase/isomerase family protein [Pyrinomonadaceae bacterium]
TRGWRGLVIGNDAADFSVGANLAGGLGAGGGEAIERGMRAMQDALMSVRFCSKPVVTAPTGRTLGGGCEVSMAGARTVAASEVYMGLVEVGVGLIPGAGGCKELVRRVVSPAVKSGADAMPFLQHALQTIAAAKVSTSAHEARTLGFLSDADVIVMNRDHQLAEAKHMVLDLSESGYGAPARASKSCYAAGRDALAALRAGLYVMQQGGYMSEYDLHVSTRVAFVLCGGELSSGQWVEEQYFLDLEREAFVALCAEPKTLERIAHMLKTGKPLRN